MIRAQYASDYRVVASHVKSAGGVTAVHSGVKAALHTPEVRHAWSALYIKLISDTAKDFAQTQQSEIADMLDDPDSLDLTGDNDLDAEIAKYAAGYTDDRVSAMLDATTDMINNRFDNAILAGMLMAELLDELKDIYSDLGETGADYLSEYETVLAGNYGMDLGADMLNIDLTKSWNAVLDERTRPWHADMDGTEVAMNEPFDVDGEQMMYPMDDSLGATGRNIYGCRCVSGYIPTGA